MTQRQNVREKRDKIVYSLGVIILQAHIQILSSHLLYFFLALSAGGGDVISVKHGLVAPEVLRSLDAADLMRKDIEQ